jgi:pilus assembly protein CpaF
MPRSPFPPPEQIKILVVDDEPVNVEVVQGLLASEQYQTLSAQNGEEALALIAADKPDLVLLDVMMPDLDGFEVCRRLKSASETLFLPVVLVTALSEREDRVKGIRVGADDFLSKPVDKQELTTRVKSLLRIKFLHDALEASNRRLNQMLETRTEQLQQATADLQRLMEEKAHYSPQLTPTFPQEGRVPAGQAVPAEREPGKDGSGSEEVDEAALRGFRQQPLSRLSGSLQGRTDLSRSPEVVSMLSERLAAIYEASGLDLPAGMRQDLLRQVLDEILGYGPIEPLLADSTVTEVMVNGPHLVYVERNGRLTKTGVHFDDDDHVMRIIDRIIRPLGRRVDRKSPMVDARLPDGSRVNAIIPPCSIDGPAITIRKFSKDKLTVEDLINFGSLTPHLAEFLEACVCSRLNIVVSGGTGSGKTTLLNVLSSFIPEDERIVTIEDSAELQLHQDHVVRLETKPADLDGSGEVTIRSLVRNALRMRPERIVVGEVRGGEALDMLQAMNTGHDGSLTTVHANNPRDTTSRLETLILMASMDLPIKVVRSQIASAVDMIVQQARLRDGSRKVTNVTEVQGMEGDVIVLSDIFAFKEEGMEDGRVQGELVPTGIRPRFGSRLEAAGFHLGSEVYMPAVRQRSVQRNGR